VSARGFVGTTGRELARCAELKDVIHNALQKPNYIYAQPVLTDVQRLRGGSPVRNVNGSARYHGPQDLAIVKPELRQSWLSSPRPR